MHRIHARLFLALGLTLGACAGPTADAAGFETGPCLDGQCFDGLSCLSELCVGDDATPHGSGGVDGDGGPADGGPGNPADGSPADDDTPDGGTPDDGTPDDGTLGDTTTGDPDDGNVDSGSACADEPGLPLGSACDPIAQDCGGCTKCAPYGPGDTWTGAHCVGINTQAVDVGESCVAIESAASGLDNCVAGALCWDLDPDTLVGMCIELCSGTAAAPSCATPGTTCAIANNGLLPLCLFSCDPIEQDCPGGDGCYVIGEATVCAPPAPANPAASPCNSINACAPGLGCYQGGGGCAVDQSCCGNFCSTPGNACLGGLECLPTTADVGVCGTP